MTSSRIQSAVDSFLTDAHLAPTDEARTQVAILSEGGPTITRRGAAATNDLYEIGSLTKLFTGLLFALMTQTGEVRPSDRLPGYLPPGTRLPRHLEEVTLHHLATHTSGLPGVPPNLDVRNPLDPYGSYTLELMYDALRRVELEHAVGTTVGYSNFGYGVLGHALAAAAGRPLPKLLTERVCSPLQLHDTTPHELADPARLLTGFGPMGRSMPHWPNPTLAGAGCLVSSIADLATFAAANLNPTRSPLADAIQLAQRAHTADGAMGYAWHARTVDGIRVLCHDGGTAGFHSFIGLAASQQTAVAVLRNTAPIPPMTKRALELLAGVAGGEA